MPWPRFVGEQGQARHALSKQSCTREAAVNVKAILAAKKRNLGGDVVCIEPTADLAAATKLLSTHRIGAVLIRGAGGRLAGILSERDIVRALSEHGTDADRKSTR